MYFGEFKFDLSLTLGLCLGGLLLCALNFILFNLKCKKRSAAAHIQYLGNGTFSATKSFLAGDSLPCYVKSLYDKIAMESRKTNRPVLGFGVDLGVPTLSVGDPEIIKAMLVSNFPVFENRREFNFAKKDKLLRQILFAMRGEEWKSWRAKLSPMMATMKVMRLFPVFDSSSQKLVKYIEDQLKSNEQNHASNTIDASLASKKFSMDVIVATTIGMDSGALLTRNPTIWEKMGDKMHVHFDGLQFFRLLALLMFPKVAEFFGISIVPFDGQLWWSEMLREKIKKRLESGWNEKRADFVQMLLEGRESGNLKKELSPEEEEGLVANSIQLLLGGYDTITSGLSFALYALATNPDVQEKVREELPQGELDANTIGELSYLDMFLNESLRMFPPAWLTDRMAEVDYKVPGTDFILKKGELISIPIYGIHHDPHNFENPSIFNPQRFENKNAVGRFEYLPFGKGARQCIATRFARLQLKTAVVHLLKKFRIEPSSQTEIPMQFCSADVLKPSKPIILSFTKL